ncbi:protein KRI1, partial [Phenoliferia sp. Uapishka_3]
MSKLYDSDSEEEKVPSFGVNQTFADKWEAKKRHEELSKLQDKYGKDYTLSDEEDEEEELSDDDSDAEFITPQVDAAILRTLAKIRQKDPTVYEEGRNVFDEEELGLASTSTLPSKSSKSSKPVLLKDYQRARMLLDPTDSLPDQPSAEGFARTFAQEAIDLKAEVTKAFQGGESDDEDDLLVPREKTKDEREKEDEEYKRFLKANVGDREVEDALEQEEKFLRDYILNRGWIDRSGNKSRIPSYNEVTGGGSGYGSPPPEKKEKKEKKAKVVAEAEEGDNETIPDPGANDSEDSEFEDRADDFEQKYNFRFEEAAGPTITTHSRSLAASTARKPTAVVSARARAREAAKEKAEEEKRERKEEVRRLKSLKRKEVEDKLRKILEAAGSGADGLEGVDLDGDWDPEEHDRKMAEIYGEEYSGAQDDDFKPAWDDDIDISDLQAAEDAEEGMTGMDEDIAYDPSASNKADKKARKDKGKRKRDEEGFPIALLEAAKNGGDEERKALLESMVDEYYGLDYEDKIGDLATRFNYTRVAPSSFSLTPVEILMATDTELNSYVSLRKYAPYRKDQDGGKKAKDKKRLKELRDALKDREWGEEIELDAEGEPIRKSKKPKWSEENGREKKERKEKVEGAATAAKRVGKKERQRRKAAEGVAGEAGKEDVEA